MEASLMAPWMIAFIVVIYYLIARRNPKSKSNTLYWDIIHDGCQHCSSDLRVVHLDLSDRGPMHVECRKCEQQYKIDHILKQAYKL